MTDHSAKLLIYAVSLAKSAANLKNLPDRIETQIFGELAVFFSRIDEISHDLEVLKKYHEVISELHSAETIVPFRYGSAVEDFAKMEIWIESEKKNYLELLNKLDGLTEMSLRVVVPPTTPAESSEPSSGRDYLLKKAQEYRQKENDAAVIELFGLKLKKYIREIKNEKRGDILSVYFLISKTDVENFRLEFSETAKNIDLQCVLTGGWCPFNFCSIDV